VSGDRDRRSGTGPAADRLSVRTPDGAGLTTAPLVRASHMTRVEVEYCVPCGMLERAQDVQTAILAEFGQSVESVSLVTGDGGVFEVRADGEVVFDKESDEFDVDAIVESVGGHVGATA